MALDGLSRDFLSHRARNVLRKREHELLRDAVRGVEIARSEIERERPRCVLGTGTDDDEIGKPVAQAAE